jgi:hypothetical protein
VVGLQTYYRSEPGNLRELTLMAVLGLITYFVHGTLNNFLDMDKASAPVWGFTAFIVAQYLQNKKR